MVRNALLQITRHEKVFAQSAGLFDVHVPLYVKGESKSSQVAVKKFQVLRSSRIQPASLLPGKKSVPTFSFSPLRSLR
jgi:hypothetical protein